MDEPYGLSFVMCVLIVQDARSSCSRPSRKIARTLTTETRNRLNRTLCLPVAERLSTPVGQNTRSETDHSVRTCNPPQPLLSLLHVNIIEWRSKIRCYHSSQVYWIVASDRLHPPPISDAALLTQFTPASKRITPRYQVAYTTSRPKHWPLQTLAV